MVGISGKLIIGAALVAALLEGKSELLASKYNYEHVTADSRIVSEAVGSRGHIEYVTYTNKTREVRFDSYDGRRVCGIESNRDMLDEIDKIILDNSVVLTREKDYESNRSLFLQADSALHIMELRHPNPRI
jgi:hypothetical protein